MIAEVVIVTEPIGREKVSFLLHVPMIKYFKRSLMSGETPVPKRRPSETAARRTLVLAMVLTSRLLFQTQGES
jgi:hypothetical protein